MNIPVLYEDNECLVINKPPSVVVNRAQSVKGETVADFAQKYLAIPMIQPVTSNNDHLDEAEFFERSGVVHRLDKDTTGILVIAKTPQSYCYLKDCFKQRTVEKSYCAFVHGDLIPPEGEIRAPVGRLPWRRERFGIVPGGKDAVTNYKKQSVIAHGVTGEPVSFVYLFPHTGRTHQLRVHLKYINHPIIGDMLYAGRKTSRTDLQWVHRIMLHAMKISIPKKNSHERLTIEAPLPDDMIRIMGNSIKK